MDRTNRIRAQGICATYYTSASREEDEVAGISLRRVNMDVDEEAERKVPENRRGAEGRTVFHYHGTEHNEFCRPLRPLLQLRKLLSLMLC